MLIGLGNPGTKYERTRHNIGFRCLETLAARHRIAFLPVSDGCAVAAGRIRGRAVMLIKPILYMNRSGEAVLRWAHNRQLSITTDGDADSVAPIVICDDIALPLGSFRLRSRGGTGGHRGLESITRAFGGEEFPRVRLGVAGGQDPIPPAEWADYVLGEFTPQEWETSESLVEYAVGAMEFLLENDLELTTSRFNRKPLQDQE